MPIKNRRAVLAAAAAVLMGIVFYAYWSLMYVPLQRQMVTEHKTLDELDQRLRLAKEKASQLNKIQAEMASLQIDVAQLEKQLPKDRELPAFLRVLTHRAESYGLTLSSLQP